MSILGGRIGGRIRNWFAYPCVGSLTDCEHLDPRHFALSAPQITTSSFLPHLCRAARTLSPPVSIGLCFRCFERTRRRAANTDRPPVGALRPADTADICAVDYRESKIRYNTIVQCVRSKEAILCARLIRQCRKIQCGHMCSLTDYTTRNSTVRVQHNVVSSKDKKCLITRSVLLRERVTYVNFELFIRSDSSKDEKIRLMVKTIRRVRSPARFNLFIVIKHKKQCFKNERMYWFSVFPITVSATDL